MWYADQGDGTYQNPVLYADYSDPDVIRVGDTYYMTASSFQYTPGLPILTSKDLVNWTLVNYAVKNIPLDAYKAPRHACGIWAPSIRYHGGFFWIFVGMPDEGIYMTRATDPLGVWSELHCVLPGKGLIDPCPLWDEDGRAYVVHAFARSRAGINSVLSIFEMAPDGSRAIGADVRVFDGTVTQPTIEGPKLYKRDGLYYILAPAGGVTEGWQTALRSSDIYGPYEERIVMHQGQTQVNGPHQGGLVADIQGDEWFLHFQDRGLAGRITHLQPVTWRDGWPLMGSIGDDGIGQPVSRHAKPPCEAKTAPTALAAGDGFTGDALSLLWQWQANHEEGFYSLERDGLRLFSKHYGAEATFPMRRAANVLTQKLVMPDFTATVTADISSLAQGDCGGLALLGSQYRALSVARTPGGYQLSLIDGTDTEDQRTLLCDIPDRRAEISLWLTYAGQQAQFAYALDGDYVQAGAPFRMRNDIWVGGKLGLFAFAEDAECTGSMVFHGITVE